jgi:uroporphyrinogen-III synthase
MLGAQVIAIPFIEIRKPRSFTALDRALGNLKNYDWLILTSANGAESMWGRLRKLRLDKRHMKHLHVAAIGPATKKAIEKRGLKVELVPDEYVAESVVNKLKDKVKGKRILLVRAKVARDIIPVELRKAGADIDVVEAYETGFAQRLAPEAAEADQRPASATCGHFHKLLDRAQLRGPAGWG